MSDASLVTAGTPRQNTTIKRIAALAVALVLCGCESPSWRRFERSDGIVDFLRGTPGEVEVPVKRVASENGYVSDTYVRAAKGGTHVAGYVENRWTREPAAGAHVDIVLRDAANKPIEFVTTHLASPNRSRAGRGITDRYRFSAHLAAPPRAGTSVEVRFHEAPTRQCGLHNPGSYDAEQHSEGNPAPSGRVNS